MKKIPDLEQIKSYFDKCIQKHGTSPQGSDWNSEFSQNIRFEQLLKVVEAKESFSLLDYGCGYGALADYMINKGYKAEYFGFDNVVKKIDKLPQ